MGYTMCSYLQNVDSDLIQNCYPNDDEMYLIDPFDNIVAGCSDTLTDVNQDRKL